MTEGRMRGYCREGMDKGKNIDIVVEGRTKQLKGVIIRREGQGKVRGDAGKIRTR